MLHWAWCFSQRVGMCWTCFLPTPHRQSPETPALRLAQPCDLQPEVFGFRPEWWTLWTLIWKYGGITRMISQHEGLDGRQLPVAKASCRMNLTVGDTCLFYVKLVECGHRITKTIIEHPVQQICWCTNGTLLLKTRLNVAYIIHWAMLMAGVQRSYSSLGRNCSRFGRCLAALRRRPWGWVRQASARRWPPLRGRLGHIVTRHDSSLCFIVQQGTTGYNKCKSSRWIYIYIYNYIYIWINGINMHGLWMWVL